MVDGAVATQRKDRDEVSAFALALGTLHVRGAEVDWPTYFAGTTAKRDRAAHLRVPARTLLAHHDAEVRHRRLAVRGRVGAAAGPDHDRRHMARDRRHHGIRGQHRHGTRARRLRRRDRDRRHQPVRDPEHAGREQHPPRCGASATNPRSGAKAASPRSNSRNAGAASSASTPTPGPFRCRKRKSRFHAEGAFVPRLRRIEATTPWTPTGKILLVGAEGPMGEQLRALENTTDTLTDDVTAVIHLGGADSLTAARRAAGRPRPGGVRGLRLRRRARGVSAARPSRPRTARSSRSSRGNGKPVASRRPPSRSRRGRARPTRA